MSRNLRVIV